MTNPPAERRWVRRVIAGAIGIVVLAGAGVIGFRAFDRPAKAVAADGPDPAQTVEIVRRDLSQARDLPGQLGYGGNRLIKDRATGTITWLPKPGATLKRGDILYRINNKPVILLYGSTPLFRPLGTPPSPPKSPDNADGVGGTENTGGPGGTGDTGGAGEADDAGASGAGGVGKGSAPPVGKPVRGPDVEVLKENLVALGYLSSATNDRVTSAVVKGIKRWQRALEVDESGVIDPATVVVLPGSVRVDSLKLALGDAGGADVLGVTSVEKVVTMPVDADSAEGVIAGAKVKLALPNGKNATGTIRSVGTDAATPPSDGSPADGGKKPQVTATIALDNQSATNGLDSGPVTVTIPGPSHKGVLVVPVAALLALREGGYAVQVVTGTTTSLVGIKTGMFADGTVEITGTGLEPGMKVVTTS